MPVVYTPESEYAKEMRRHEAHHTQFGPPGRPYVFAEYPMRLYKFTRQPSGDRTCEGFTVATEQERQNMESRGFVAGGPQAALEVLEQTERQHAELAAEINYDARHGMGDKARSEVEAHQEAAGARHLPVIPETPIKKRGRPVKIKLTDAE